MSFKKIALLSTIISFNAFANIVTEGAFINGRDLNTFELIKKNKELTIDHVSQNGFEVYGPNGLKNFLKQNNIKFSNLETVNQSFAANYPTYLEIENELKSLQKTYPSILKLYSIGKSVKGKNLYVVKLSTNVNVDDARPEFKYIANMHGDEIVGREMMVSLIKFLAENYGKDARITNLLNTTQIHIMPSMNPDGAEKRTRANANGFDLNRNFPDFSTTDNQDVTTKRQPETIAVMNWQKAHNFILSANFHGGAEVVNYPWDTSAEKFPKEELAKELSLDYAHDASYIGASTAFENGITNGYAWYEVDGGMQDWSIYYRGDFQITIELSNTKWPDYSNIGYYFEQNKWAMVGYIENINKLKASTYR